MAASALSDCSCLVLATGLLRPKIDMPLGLSRTCCTSRRMTLTTNIKSSRSPKAVPMPIAVSVRANLTTAGSMSCLSCSRFDEIPSSWAVQVGILQECVISSYIIMAELAIRIAVRPANVFALARTGKPTGYSI